MRKFVFGILLSAILTSIMQIGVYADYEEENILLKYYSDNYDKIRFIDDAEYDDFKNAFLIDIDNDKKPELVTDIWSHGAYLSVYKVVDGQVVLSNRTDCPAHGTGLHEYYEIILEKSGMAKIHDGFIFNDSVGGENHYDEMHTIYEVVPSQQDLNKIDEIEIYRENNQYYYIDAHSNKTTIDESKKDDILNEFLSKIKPLVVYSTENQNAKIPISEIWDKQQELFNNSNINADKNNDSGNDLQKDISVYVDNRKIEFDQPPIIINDRTMVPIRAIAEAFNAEVEWKDYYVEIKKDNVIANIPIYGTRIEMGNYRYVSDILPKIVNDRTLVPIRVVANVLLCKTDWDGNTRSVYISSVPAEDDSKYENIKLNKEKPLVYTNCEETKKDSCWHSYCIPKININDESVQQINRLLEENIKNLFFDSINEDLAYKQNYKYNIKDGILSLLVAENRDCDVIIYKTYNYDIENKRFLNNEDIVRKYAPNYNEYLEHMHSYCKNSFIADNSSDIENVIRLGGVTRELYEECIKNSEGAECYNINSDLFIENDGRISAVVDFPSIAGASSYYYLIDTGLNVT